MQKSHTLSPRFYTKPPSEREGLLKEFVNFGGDRLFLFRLSAGIKFPFTTHSFRTASVSMVEVQEYRKRTRELRDALNNLQKKVNVVDLVDLVAVLRTMEDIFQEAGGVLKRLDADRQQLVAPRRSRRGHPVMLTEIYAWLGGLVPYTAFRSKSGKPNWSWIDRWLEFEGFNLPAGGSQKLWSKTVTVQYRKCGHINSHLAVLLAQRVEQFPQYVVERSKKMRGKRRMALLRQSARYWRVAQRLMRFLKGPIFGTGSVLLDPLERNLMGTSSCIYRDAVRLLFPGARPTGDNGLESLSPIIPTFRIDPPANSRTI